MARVGHKDSVIRTTFGSLLTSSPPLRTVTDARAGALRSNLFTCIRHHSHKRKAGGRPAASAADDLPARPGPRTGGLYLRLTTIQTYSYH